MKKVLILVILIFILITSSSCFNPKHEHTFGSWEVIEEATIDKDGYKCRFCSCGESETEIIYATGFSWSRYASSEYLELISNKLISSEGMTFDKNEFDTITTKIYADIENDDPTSLEKDMQALDDYNGYILVCYSIANVYFSATAESIYEEQKNLAIEYDDKITNEKAKIYKLAEDASLKIQEVLFNTSDKKEIEQIIKEQKMISDYSALSVELEKIEDDVSKAITKYPSYTTEFVDICANAMVEEINLTRSVSAKYDMEPLDFLYNFRFFRHYNSEDIVPLFEYVKKYISPNYTLFSKIYGDYDQTLLDNLMNKPITYNKGLMPGSLLDEYYRYVGGDIADAYIKHFSDGYFYFTNNDKALGTAYIDSNGGDIIVSYFSKTHQLLSSVAHEMGHYYAAYIDSIDDETFTKQLSYDILETHSQGNEACLYNYLKTKYWDNPTIKLYADFEFLDLVDSIIAGSYLCDVEYYAYNKENVTAQDIINYANSVYDSYDPNGYYNENYWAYSAATPVYYISYVTSAIASSEFYTMDLDEALSTYQEFITNNKRESEIEHFTNAGLNSPFCEQAFIDLSNEIKRINQLYQQK